MKKLFCLAAVFIAATNVFAQTHFTRKDSIPVFIGNQLLYPWAGGMNYCQYSDIDLNLDGINDLFLFDRSGNKITTFLNNGTPNQVDYRYAPQYIPQFPRMKDWALLRDYNCDGKMDIFTSVASEIVVYKNVSSIANGLQFQQLPGVLMVDRFPNSTHQLSPLNVSWIDVPAIRDIDSDGDLDVLSFGVGGQQMEYYRNMSMETYGTCDSLTFVLESMCWGEWTESQLDATITLNTTCSAPPIHPVQNNNAFLHAGSCMECINTDGDNDMDILVGDLANYYINLVRNGGSNTYAIGDSIDDHFPGYDTAVQINLFGCGYHLDVDNDGKKDVLFSPNNNAISENFHSSWYYHNTGANDSVRLHFVTRDFMQHDMIDVGEGAIPAFFDYDNDGDLDLFIGDKAYFDIAGIPPSRLALLRNDGTNTTPSYTLVTRNLLGLDTLNGTGLPGIAPTFGDIDNDGDKDMLIGDVNGKLYLFRKDPGSDTNFVLDQPNYMGIDVGSFAVPQFVDVDRDGKLDLLIGEQTGNVNYYRNTGSQTVAAFSLVTPLFGNVMVTEAGFTTGYSTPFLYDDHGSHVLFVGSERGFLFRFDNIDGNLAGNFTLTDSLYVSHYEGGRIAVNIADLNNDSLFDVIIGNYAGGCAIFYGDNNTGLDENVPSTVVFSLYPNPANEQLVIETATTPLHPETLTICNLSGETVQRETIVQQRQPIDVSKLASGVYLCRLTDQNGFTTNQKFIISR